MFFYTMVIPINHLFIQILFIKYCIFPKYLSSLQRST
nr:MAG TPA: hypothetical protein [Caudoviricetes sp.]